MFPAVLEVVVFDELATQRAEIPQLCQPVLVTYLLLHPARFMQLYLEFTTLLLVVTRLHNEATPLQEVLQIAYTMAIFGLRHDDAGVQHSTRFVIAIETPIVGHGMRI